LKNKMSMNKLEYEVEKNILYKPVNFLIKIYNSTVDLTNFIEKKQNEQMEKILNQTQRDR